MLLGCARVSTDAEDAAAQRRAVEVVACEGFFEEKASGNQRDGPQLPRPIERLRRGNVLSASFVTFSHEAPCT